MNKRGVSHDKGLINETKREDKLMGKILESLPLTIVAGIVLTVIMVLATNYIEESQMSGAEKAVSDVMEQMD
jgi:hypothetical protein